MPATDTFYFASHIGTPPESTDATSKNDTIADLSCFEIESMSRLDLIDVVRESHTLTLRPDAEQRMQILDEPTLRRLVYIIRRGFQQRGYGTACVCGHSVQTPTPQRKPS